MPHNLALELQNTRTASLLRSNTPTNECPGYYTKRSNGEVTVILELCGIQSTPSLPLLPFVSHEMDDFKRLFFLNAGPLLQRDFYQVEQFLSSSPITSMSVKSTRPSLTSKRNILLGYRAPSIGK